MPGAGVVLHVGEGTRPPVDPGAMFTALGRRISSRLPFLAVTVPAGIAGSMAALALSWALQLRVLNKPELAGSLLLAGMLHGLLAPFTAPWQMRRPWAATIYGLAFSLGSFAVLDALHLRYVAAIPWLVASFLGALAFASGLAELVAGHRTEVGERLGSLGGLVRGGVAWLAVAVSVLGMAWVEQGHLRLDLELLKIALTVGLMGAAVAVPASEQGKAAFLDAIGRGESRERLPGT